MLLLRCALPLATSIVRGRVLVVKGRGGDYFRSGTPGPCADVTGRPSPAATDGGAFASLKKNEKIYHEGRCASECLLFVSNGHSRNFVECKLKCSDLM